MGEESKTSCQAYPMIGGEGNHSYAQNSAYQRGVVDAAKEKIKEVIRLTKLDISPNTFRIVDLGCSTGPNTFIAVQNIIEAIKLKYDAENFIQDQTQVLEFQVFFNDHTENDFNTLFKSLPPSCTYFASGVPGSFYRRLFPKSSIDLAHTSYALHWLTKIPKDIEDRNSAAWNKSSLQCTGLIKEVVAAYEAQYKQDVMTFLNARAEEIVPGGLLIILAPGLPDGVVMVQTWQGAAVEFVSSCLIDMAKSGLVCEEKVQSFNLPVYFAHGSDLQEAIQENGCFSIEKMEIFFHHMKDLELSTEFVTSMFRAVLGGAIKAYFGHDIGDKLFQHVEEKMAKCPPNFKEYKKNVELFFVLRRI